MTKFLTFFKACGAGLAIAIGAAAYLSCENKIVGAFMFTVGLFTICFFGLELYTGKIGYILDMKHPIKCLVIWLGNAVGCVIGGAALRYACPAVAKRAAALTDAKLEIPLWRLFILGIFCGMLMYIAVHNYRKSSGGLTGCIGILICVPAFILCGFEHCIANIVYFAIGVGSLSELTGALLATVTVTAANAVGAVLFRRLSNGFKSEKADGV